MEIIFDSPMRDDSIETILKTKTSKEILGRGSYGIVLRAIYRGQSVAMKLIKNSNQMKFETVNNEANIVGWCHENIIQILKVSVMPKYSIILMERSPGICLQLLIDSLAIPLFHQICICQDILKGLSYCHQKGLVHLDIKPSNILIAFDSNDLGLPKSVGASGKFYKCKICDFGCSRNFTTSQKEPKHNGTIRYMSPEILQGLSAGPRDDVFSFGITVWQLNTNKFPYNEIESNEVVAYKVVKHQIRPDCVDQASSRSKDKFENQINCMKCSGCFLDNESISEQFLAPKSTQYFKNTVNQSKTPEARKHQASILLSNVRRKRSATEETIVDGFLPNKRMLSIPIQVNPLGSPLGSLTENPTTRFLIDCFQRRNLIDQNRPNETKIQNTLKWIYGMCWHMDYGKRPSVNLLENYFDKLQRKYYNKPM